MIGSMVVTLPNRTSGMYRAHTTWAQWPVSVLLNAPCFDGHNSQRCKNECQKISYQITFLWKYQKCIKDGTYSSSSTFLTFAPFTKPWTLWYRYDSVTGLMDSDVTTVAIAVNKWIFRWSRFIGTNATSADHFFGHCPATTTPTTAVTTIIGGSRHSVMITWRGWFMVPGSRRKRGIQGGNCQADNLIRWAANGAKSVILVASIRLLNDEKVVKWVCTCINVPKSCRRDANMLILVSI